MHAHPCIVHKTRRNAASQATCVPHRQGGLPVPETCVLLLPYILGKKSGECVSLRNVDCATRDVQRKFIPEQMQPVCLAIVFMKQ